MQIVEAKQCELEEFRKHKAQFVNELEEQKITIQKSRDLAMNQYNKRRELETKLNDEKTPEVAALLHKIERLKNVKTQKIDVRKLFYFICIYYNVINALPGTAASKSQSG